MSLGGPDLRVSQRSEHPDPRFRNTHRRQLLGFRRQRRVGFRVSGESRHPTRRIAGCQEADCFPFIHSYAKVWTPPREPLFPLLSSEARARDLIYSRITGQLPQGSGRSQGVRHTQTHQATTQRIASENSGRSSGNTHWTHMCFTPLIQERKRLGELSSRRSARDAIEAVSL